MEPVTTPTILPTIPEWTPPPVAKDLRPRLRVVVLQHPQEPDKLLGTAKLLTDSLVGAQLEVALSRSSLAHALGLPKTERIDPKRWVVLYLGSGIKSPAGPECTTRPLVFLSKTGEPAGQPPAPRSLDGILILDGTWSQAKALWWRNPWLLKLWRAALQPGTPSLYGARRKEPRRECVSTLESAARALTALGESPAIEQELIARFETFLKALPPRAPRGAPGDGSADDGEAKPKKRDWRKRNRHRKK